MTDLNSRFRSVGTVLSMSAAAVVRKPYDGRSYAGLSYEASSRTGEQLLTAALETGCWVHLPEHLAALRQNMRIAA